MSADRAPGVLTSVCSSVGHWLAAHVCYLPIDRGPGLTQRCATAPNPGPIMCRGLYLVLIYTPFLPASLNVLRTAQATCGWCGARDVRSGVATSCACALARWSYTSSVHAGDAYTGSGGCSHSSAMLLFQSMHEAAQTPLLRGRELASVRPPSTKPDIYMCYAVSFWCLEMHRKGKQRPSQGASRSPRCPIKTDSSAC